MSLIKFVNNEPAIAISDNGKYLVIADVHLGITYELEHKGVNIPNQTDGMIKHILKLKNRTKASHLIILGDAKHAVPGTPHDERKDVREFFEALQKEFESIVLVKGNHDTLIEEIVPWLKVVAYVKIGSCLLTHGHKKMPKDDAKCIIIAHNHPVVKFKDRAGALYYQRCWLIDEGERKIIDMPAFNVLAGGKAINDDGDMLGPIAKRIDVATAHVHLLDGTDIGVLKDLEIKRKGVSRHKR